MKSLLKCTIDNCSEDGGMMRYTPLISAVRYNRSEMLRVLLEDGANVEGAEDDWFHALFLAAWGKRADMCRLLLDWGKKMDFFNMLTTPLASVEELMYQCQS